MDRYYVDHSGAGYVIRDSNRIMSLPFNYFSKQYADKDCKEFNEKGPVAVVEQYYISKIAGNGYGLSYEKFMTKNRHIFD